MRLLKVLLISSFILLFNYVSHSQIIVSLIFGEALNNPNTQFGLDIGANSSTVTNYDISDYTAGFEIGMFFNWKYADKMALYSGVVANSNRGFRGGEVLIDPIYRPGEDSGYEFKYMKTRLVYVGAHSSIRYYFAPGISIAGGVNLSLLLKATNEAAYENGEADMGVAYNVRNQFLPIDAGPIVALMYQFRQGKGLSINAKAYYGLLDVAVDVPGVQNSYFFQLTAGILIGAKKGSEIAEELNP